MDRELTALLERVGEHGPEIVSLPLGAWIYDTAASRGGLPAWTARNPVNFGFRKPAVLQAVRPARVTCRYCGTRNNPDRVHCEKNGYEY